MGAKKGAPLQGPVESGVGSGRDYFRSTDEYLTISQYLEPFGISRQVDVWHDDSPSLRIFQVVGTQYIVVSIYLATFPYDFTSLFQGEVQAPYDGVAGHFPAVLLITIYEGSYFLFAFNLLAFHFFEILI